MKTFSVKNFEKFQHYKDRAPPWIKLYNELLDDYDFACLQDASKMHLIAIWLLASRSENKIPYDSAWISKRINATDHVDLDALAAAGFIIVNQELQSVEQVASNPLAECLSRDRGETETEGEERQKEIRAPALVFESDWPRDYREQFWRDYPKRVDKQAAFKKLEQIRRSGKVPWETLIGGVQRYAGKVVGRDPTYTKGPAAWLNAGKWDDEDAPAFSIDDVCPPSIYRGVL